MVYTLRSFILFTLLASCCLLTSCGDSTSYLPKPRSYPRVEFPQGELVEFALEKCPFSFQHPDYIKVERDTAFFSETPVHPCWYDLVYPQLNARVHFSYYPVGGTKDFERLRDDAYYLVGKHNLVADYIEETPLAFPQNRVFGFSFDIDGNVASPYQFFVTDSTTHFLRGSLYVNAEASADSLSPIYSFVKTDIGNAIKTLSWR